MKENRKLKSLRVEGLEKDNLFSTGIVRKRYYIVLKNSDIGLKARSVDEHGVPFPGKPKLLCDRKFVKRFTPLRTKLRCH